MSDSVSKDDSTMSAALSQYFFCIHIKSF